MTKLLLLLLILPLAGFGQSDLEKQSFLYDKIELLVPKGFIVMSPQMEEQKYPNRSQQPNVVLTDETGEINILIARLDQHIGPDQVTAFKDFQMNTLKQLHPDAKWIDDGVKTVNGKNVGYFKFIANTADQPVFNYYFFTDMDGRVLLITFNCTGKLLPQWQNAAEAIAASLKVRQ